MIFRTMTALGALIVMSPVMQADEPIRQLGVHAHGKGTLSLVVDGKALEIELTSPLMNIVGFEHAPHSAAEKEVYDQAIDWLKSPDNVLDLSAAACEVTRVNLVEPDFESDDSHDEKG